MPLITEPGVSSSGDQNGPRLPPVRRQSAHSGLAKASMSNSANSARQADGASDSNSSLPRRETVTAEAVENGRTLRAQPAYRARAMMAASDTPNPTAPPSPSIVPFLHSALPLRQGSSESLSRLRATTLDIPGLTKSKVSPDGKISQRDVGSKLVIVMVGLPARGKSYITKKLARYLNWLQHDTKIFNVGERRRVAAGGLPSRRTSEQLRDAVDTVRKGIARPQKDPTRNSGTGTCDPENGTPVAEPTTYARPHTTSNGVAVETGGLNKGIVPPIPELRLPVASADSDAPALSPPAREAIDQSASFFDPSNRKAALIREQAALDALDDLLNYILVEGGSIGILDATNSTLERRKLIMKHIKDRAGPDLNVLFLESLCVDEELLERNMRLKLFGPDYKGKDPEASLADFKRRIAMYEQSYVPLGEYEEKNNLPFVQMIDVGRKVISHQIKGFLSSQAVYYLLNFNLAPRQIWITRHGESYDNLNGKIGGDSDLSPEGHQFAQALTKFINYQRKEWDIHEQEKVQSSHLPPQPGDTTPPNPHYESEQLAHTTRAFCVWTSMLKRSIQTAESFDEDAYDTKQMRMLNELYAGYLEEMTYPQIRSTYPDEYASRVMDKLRYRYPGPGGEGYLDVIHRVRPVIVELERMTHHCLLITHRSVVRVLLAYFTGLSRSRVTELDVPIGMLYCLEPKPFGVDLKAYRYNADEEWFDLQPEYEAQNAPPSSDPA